MSNKPVTPQDVIADGVDFAELNDRTVRKGTMRAFLVNVEVFENPQTDEKTKQAALAIMQKLAPDVIATGLHKHVVFKNPEIEAIFISAASQNLS